MCTLDGDIVIVVCEPQRGWEAHLDANASLNETLPDMVEVKSCLSLVQRGPVDCRFGCYCTQMSPFL